MKKTFKKFTFAVLVFTPLFSVLICTTNQAIINWSQQHKDDLIYMIVVSFGVSFYAMYKLMSIAEDF